MGTASCFCEKELVGIITVIRAKLVRVLRVICYEYSTYSFMTYKFEAFSCSRQRRKKMKCNEKAEEI